MTQVYKATPLYTVREISTLFGISIAALQRALWEKRIPGICKSKLWLIDPKDVEVAIIMGRLRTKR